MKISELKKEAKIKLAGKWPLAILINLTQLLIVTAVSYSSSKAQGIVGALLAIVLWIISVPISYGITVSMLNLSRNKNVGVTDFISIGFKNFKRAIFISLSIFIRILIPVLLFAFSIIFSMVCITASIIGGYSNTGISLIFALVIALASMIWIIYKMLSYALSTYIFVDNEDLKCKEAIAKSRELMKGNKLKFIGLVLSFFGWFLLCGFLAGCAEEINQTVGTIVLYGLSLLLTPYITFSEINFYEDLAGIADVKEVTVEKAEKIEEVENTTIE